MEEHEELAELVSAELVELVSVELVSGTFKHKSSTSSGVFVFVEPRVCSRDSYKNIVAP